MRMKRSGKWVIVLCLLAALLVTTAALAQGQEVPEEETALAPAAELGESITPFPWVNDESPNNNTIDRATYISQDSYGHVLGGTIETAGDVDYWGLLPSWAAEQDNGFLFNIDARSFGSPLDSVICLYSDDGIELGCNNDMQGSTSRDSLLYYNLEGDRLYYLKVTNFNGNAGGSNFRYQLQVSHPLLISAAAGKLGAGANVVGIPIQSGDVLAWSEITQYHDYPYIKYEKWVMLLDLSDLGVAGNLVNLSAGWRNSDYLLVSFANNVTLPGITGQVSPWEVVVYDPSQVGPDTVGTFQRWWNGKQQGLTTLAEKPDAIHWPEWNGTTKLAVSTGGASAVPGASGVLKLPDEDVGLWSIDNHTWSRQLDGQGWTRNPRGVERNWGLGAKDVIAYSATWWHDYADFFENYFVVIQGAGTVVASMRDEWGDHWQYSVSYSQKDIVRLHDMDLDGWTEHGASVWWHGPDHGWNYNIDAIHVCYPFGDYYIPG